MPLSSYFHYHFLPDTQTLEQNAEDYTPERVGQFLETIGLGHHVAAFIEKEISGEMLLEPEEEMFEELGVTSLTEGLKIKVQELIEATVERDAKEILYEIVLILNGLVDNFIVDNAQCHLFIYILLCAMCLYVLL